MDIRRLYYYSGGGKVLLRAVVLDRPAIDVDDVVTGIAEKAGTPRHLDTCETRNSGFVTEAGRLQPSCRGRGMRVPIQW